MLAYQESELRLRLKDLEERYLEEQISEAQFLRAERELVHLLEDAPRV